MSLRISPDGCLEGVSQWGREDGKPRQAHGCWDGRQSWWPQEAGWLGPWGEGQRSKLHWETRRPTGPSGLSWVLLQTVARGGGQSPEGAGGSECWNSKCEKSPCSHQPEGEPWVGCSEAFAFTTGLTNFNPRWDAVLTLPMGRTREGPSPSE